MATRVEVKGSYINKSLYRLCDMNSDVFMDIEEGVPVHIGNQLRDFIPVRVPRKDGHGTILELQKYGDGGDVIERVPLIQHKHGLWALTSGAARNGVFHWYHEPNALEALWHFEELGNGPRPVSDAGRVIYADEDYIVLTDFYLRNYAAEPAEAGFTDDFGWCSFFMDTGESAYVDFDEEASGSFLVEVGDRPQCWYRDEEGMMKAFRAVIIALTNVDRKGTVDDIKDFVEAYPQYADIAKAALLEAQPLVKEEWQDF